MHNFATNYINIFMKNFTKSLFLFGVTLLLGASSAIAQFGCGSAIVIADGYTATGITTAGTGGPEDWNTNPTGTSIDALYWDDDVYLFEYTAGATDEQISMTIFTNNAWTGIGIFDDCSGTTFSNELDAAAGSSSSAISLTVNAIITAGNTVYIAVGQWGSPNDLDFDVTNFSVATCFDPSALTATNVTATTADVGWTENGASTSWNIEYGTAGFTPTGTPTIANTSNNPESLTGLSSATDYEFYVQADCGGSGTSNWVGPFAFSTACTSFTPNYLTDFTTFLPNCWDQATNGDLTTGPTGIGSSSWAQNGSIARFDVYSTGSSDWLLSPNFDLSAGGWELVIEASAFDYYSTGTFSGMGSDDSVQIVISTDGGTTWSSLYTFDSNNEPAFLQTDYIIDLSTYTGTNNQFGILVSNGSISDSEDYWFNVHRFEIREIPSCVAPTGVSVGNVTESSVEVSWTAGSVSTVLWDVSIVPSGDSPVIGAGTNSNPETFSGLTANTDYDVYVRDICAVGDSSTWVGPIPFTTLCGVYTPDYLEEFGTYMPDCWEEAQGLLTSSATLTPGGSDWTYDGFANSGTTGAARVNIWTTDQDEWLISPSIDLTGGPFQLEYDVALTTYSGTGATTMDADDSLVVVISTDNGATWSNTNMLQVYTNGSEPSNSGQREYIDLSGYTGVVKFGLYASSTQDLSVDNNAYIDNFLVTALCMPTNGTDVQTACDSYTWIDGNTYTASNNTATYIMPGANANGCDSIITLDLTIVNTPVNATTTNGSAITADATGASYQWLDCNNGNAIIPGETAQTFVAPLSGNYAVEVSNAGCIDTSACEAITVAAADLIITEINYNGAEAGTDSTEFIEVYNNGANTVNMSGYSFTSGVIFTAGPNTLVPASGYIVFAVDSSVMANVYGYTGAYTFTGGLSNSGEAIALTDANGNLVDTVDYDDATPWPSGFNAGEPDGGGASLILCDYSTDNNDGSNWSVATAATGVTINTLEVYGSPGAANTCIIECPSAFAVTACDSYTVPSGNETYTTSGVYMDTILGSTGCDSVMTITLTINNSTTSTVTETACDSLVWNGTTYYTSGTYTWTGTNAVSCDSVVTLNLTINNATTSTVTETACDSLDWNGATYYTSGTYTWTGTNAVGCDSVVTLDLTINNSTTSTVTETACDSLVWNGSTYYTSGTYTWTGSTTLGCDSVVTLDLTINNAVATSVTETACGSYDWNGMTYTTSGTYTWTGTTATGCDSVVTLDLTINTVDVTVTNNDPSITANASGATYQWIDCDDNNAPISGETGQTFTATANGNYAVIVTENGCTDTSACQPIVTVSLDEASPIDVVSVYPNPVKNVVNVDLAGLENAQVRLLDMSGKVLRSEKCNTTELFVMEMNEAPGAYIIEVQSNDFVKQFKLIKE